MSKLLAFKWLLNELLLEINKLKFKIRFINIIIQTIPLVISTSLEKLKDRYHYGSNILLFFCFFAFLFVILIKL